MWKSNSDSELQSSCVSNCDNHQSRGKNFLIQTRDRVRNLFHRKAEADKENAFRFHRRKSWPPKCDTKDDELIFRQQSNCRKKSVRKQWPKEKTSTDQELSRIDLFKRLEITGSRVRERIEDFENKQPTNSVVVGVPNIVAGNPNNAISRETKSGAGSLLFKKNFIAKNGLVSNLACQFESRELSTTSETCDSNEWNTGECDQVKLNASSTLVYSRLMKPPIPPSPTSISMTAAHSSNHIDDQIECLSTYLSSSSCENPAHQSNAAVYSQFSDQASSGLLKRALSYDQMIMLDSNHCHIHSPLSTTTTTVSSSDSSLKKCKKSLAVRSSMDSNNNDDDCDRPIVLPGNNDQHNEIITCHQLLQPLHRTCSLPNIADDDQLNGNKAACSRLKGHCRHCGNSCHKSVSNHRIKRSSIKWQLAHMGKAWALMTPLDLQFLRQMTCHHCNDETKCSHNDGFVRRRAERLETYKHDPSSSSNASANTIRTDESESMSERPFKHSPNFDGQLKLSKSFNHPSSSIKSSIESAIMSATLTAEKKSKKTYGKSHPLDKLNRASTIS